MRLLLSLVIVLAGSTTRAADSWSVTPTTRLTAAAVEHGRGVLAASDDFIRNLSPFDRAARLRTNGPVSLQQFTNFAASQGLAWTDPELVRLGDLAGSVSNRLAGWQLPLPTNIWIIKTSGREEGDAAYTRGSAIILPVEDLQKPAAQLERTVLHEVFHILSRHNPPLRERLYHQLGFQRCGPIALPGDFAARKITNPDAPLSEHYLKVSAGGSEVQVLPVLFSREPGYRAGDTRPFFAYLEFRLMEIAEQAGHWQPVLRDGAPVLHQPAAVGNFFEQIGRNTQYIIHPEEVLADNFVLLLQGARDVPNPEILTRMAEVLRRADNR